MQIECLSFMRENGKCKLSKEKRPIQVRTLRTKVTSVHFLSLMQNALYYKIQIKTKGILFLCCMCRDTVCLHICAMSNIYANFCSITSHSPFHLLFLFQLLCSHSYMKCDRKKKTSFRRCCLVSEWC